MGAGRAPARGGSATCRAASERPAAVRAFGRSRDRIPWLPSRGGCRGRRRARCRPELPGAGSEGELP
eukprot:5418802-Alexandrium_andersonii.AAC.1